MSNDTTKTYSKCGQTFPATLEYFHPRKNAIDSLHSWCKECKREYHRLYYQANQDRLRELHRNYEQNNKDEINKRKRIYYQENSDKKRKYQQINKDRIDKYQLEYRQINKEKTLQYAREYRQVNKEKHREYMREYQRVNSDKMRIYYHRREARKRSLPDTYTEQEWIACLEYFNYACAVCAVSFEDAKSHADHWIPLSSDECTGTIATNMVCLCDVCNMSKHDKLPEIWLIERYGVDRANEILGQIEVYFNSLE